MERADVPSTVASSSQSPMIGLLYFYGVPRYGTVLSRYAAGLSVECLAKPFDCNKEYYFSREFVKKAIIGLFTPIIITTN